MYATVKPILEACLNEDAPVEALYQARDILEMILTTAEKSGTVPTLSFSDAEQKVVTHTFATFNINDEVSFRTILGCVDLLLESAQKEQIFQAKCFFSIIIKSL